MAIVLPKKTKKQKGHGFYEVPMVHGDLGADGEASKIFGCPQSPYDGAIPALTVYLGSEIMLRIALKSEVAMFISLLNMNKRLLLIDFQQFVQLSKCLMFSLGK